jgi:acetyltransferase-like isoleucine patch superfamily enzyme
LKAKKKVLNSISPDARLGKNVQVWDFAQIRSGASIGDDTLIGSYVYIDSNVQIGKKCKIQNRAMIYDCALIQDGVFIGPGAILTNDKTPRAILSSGKLKGLQDWVKVGVEVCEGASISAGAICIAPVKIGKWSLIGAGAVVTKDVKQFALVVGNPARQIGWVGHAGVPLIEISDEIFQCPKTQTKFEQVDFELREIIQG